MTVTLCDASPLVALINQADNNHVRAVAAVQTIRGSVVTVWPCVAEAMHLLNNFGGWRAQDELWDFFEIGAVDIHTSAREERIRMRTLMDKYRSTPMDLADAALVAAAEALGVTRVFTFDADFYVYRIDGTKAFDVIP